MYALVYTSVARAPFSPAELGQLLTGSRAQNALCGITGLLLHAGGTFVQLLEGDETSVRGIFEKISADERHHGVVVLLEERIPERCCEGWSMAFRDLESGDLNDAPGFSDFLKPDAMLPRLQPSSARSQRLLRLLRQGMVRV